MRFQSSACFRKSIRRVHLIVPLKSDLELKNSYLIMLSFSNFDLIPPWLVNLPSRSIEGSSVQYRPKKFFQGWKCPSENMLGVGKY